jgi:hypothetical protein
MPKRTKITIAGKPHYAERNKKGQFTDVTTVGKSLAADRRKVSAKKVKPGYGHLGDR